MPQYATERVGGRRLVVAIWSEWGRVGALMLRSARLVTALALLVLLPGPALAQTKAGVVTNLEGSATAARSRAPQPVALKFKDDVLLNDRIVTGDRSIVRMLLGGKASVTVRERSALTITEVPGKSTVHLDAGKIAVAVAQERMKPGELIEVKTPNAVAAVRGTVFIIEVIRATTQATPGPGGVTTNAYWFSGSGTLDFSGSIVNMLTGRFASGTGSQPPSFGNMTPGQAQNAASGLHVQGQSVGDGQNGAKDNVVGTTLATFGQGGGLPQPTAVTSLVSQNRTLLPTLTAPVLPGGVQTSQVPQPTPAPEDLPPPVVVLPAPDVLPAPVVVPPPAGPGFKPAGTPTGVLVFGDRASGSTLSSDLSSLGRVVSMNVNTLPADLSVFGTIWHMSAFTPLTADEQARLASFLALGRGVHITGERPCCEGLNLSLQSLARAVVVDGASIQIGGLGDIAGPHTFNPSARGGVTTGLTTWTSFAPGGIAGISGANVLVSGLLGVPVGAVWDSGDLVGGAGRLTLLMDSDWIFGGIGLDNPNRLAVIENIQRFIDDPPAPLNLTGPLLRSTGEQLETGGTFLQIVGYTVTGGGSDPLLWLSGSRVTTAADLVRMSDSAVSTGGSFTRLDSGAEIIQTSVAEPLVSMRGGSLDVGTGGGGHLFDLAGRPANTQVDPETGLTLGTDRPLQPGAEAPVFEATNATVSVRGSAYRVDTALLEATAPLLNLAGGTALATGAHAVDLVGRARISIPNDAIAMIGLNSSSLTVANGNLVNVAGGSQLNLAGSLLSLGNGSTVNILNGLLLNVTGGSSVTIGGSLVSFSGGGNLLDVRNGFAPTAMLGGVPVYGPTDGLRISGAALAGLGSAGSIKINGVTLTPTTPLSSLTGSLVAVQGGGTVRVGN
jgi:hypothetical protein